MAEDTSTQHVHSFDSEVGGRFIGNTMMLSCECGATKLFTPPSPEKKAGKLLQFPSSMSPEQPEPKVG